MQRAARFVLRHLAAAEFSKNRDGSTDYDVKRDVSAADSRE
jgi:hypothetical protein